MKEKKIMDTNITEKQSDADSAMEMDAQQKIKLEKAKFLIEAANRFRLIFLFVAFLILLFMMLGGKIWDEASWFEGASRHVMDFLYWDLGFMVIATFVKFFFVVKYNRIVKNL